MERAFALFREIGDSVREVSVLATDSVIVLLIAKGVRRLSAKLYSIVDWVLCRANEQGFPLRILLKAGHSEMLLLSQREGALVDDVEAPFVRPWNVVIVEISLLVSIVVDKTTGV